MRQRYALQRPGGRRRPTEESLLDYRDVGACKVAVHDRRPRDGRRRSSATVHTIEFNVPLDPALFTKPRADPAPVRVMISCGEPSGDLYAGALAARDPARRPVGRDRRLRRRSSARRRRDAGRRLQRPLGHRAARGRCASCRGPTRPTGGSCSTPQARSPRRVRRRSTFPTSISGSRARDPQARRPGRLLHQPAALGVAPRAG